MARNIETSAELLVASKFRENGWEIYFPHKDDGFDFVATTKIKKSFALFRSKENIVNQVKTKPPMVTKDY